MISNSKIQSFAFIELKSYGDLVITAASLRLLNSYDLDRCCLFISPHLNDLATSLDLPCVIKLLPTEDLDVPPLFDIKKRGLIAGLKSALTLRNALETINSCYSLVLSQSSYKERFIVGRRSWLHLPSAENIYTASEQFMRGTFLDLKALSNKRVKLKNRIGLCPFSRVDRKNLPPHLINQLAQVCAEAGFEPELILLDGEQWSGSIHEFSIRTIRRCFKSLGETLEEYAGVISADSLPAHLAEYRGTPAFVVSPITNTYWLPKRAFEGQHWGIIDKPVELSFRIQRFLFTL